MTSIHKTRNPFPSVTDQQWIKFILMLTDNVMALNGLVLSKVEIMLTEGGHYPAAYFRLTSTPEKPGGLPVAPLVSGFLIGFDLDWDKDVIIQPLSPQGYQENWLSENGINSVFTYHDVGLQKLMTFLEKELQLWQLAETALAADKPADEWRELALS
ncbi:hypothetical protein [uncultured Mucilaginibacter sp.]|uniref:hypothetical protein n=1 Tax=uncultured Mucilaginibacter sp. TaxID=797541 RepID=UPI0025E25B85|nr:hypothetical protein [uncultured Mucilaginibacter sp.]